MNKKEIVELESSFLDFCSKATNLGYKFVGYNKLELQHNSETKNSMSGKVVLDPIEFTQN